MHLWDRTDSLTYRPFIQRFPTNTRGRDFVIGDLHGQYDLLMRGMDHVRFDQSVDRMFSVGDLIDRGPDSVLCLQLTKKPWFHAVIGNHELMMLQRDYGEFSAWMENGGEWWNDTLDVERDELDRLALKLPVIISVGEGNTRFNVVHGELAKPIWTDAEIDATPDLEKGRSVDDLTWGRSIIERRASLPALRPGLSMTFVGHSGVDVPVQIASHWFIDTRICKGGSLTIAEVGQPPKFVQIP